MKRSDIHRPSVINPEEYVYVGVENIKIEGLGDVLYLAAMKQRIRQHMARTGGTYSHHSHGGNCMVCGNAFAIYTILFHHYPSNTYVRVGQNCADKFEYSHSDFNAFTAAVRGEVEAQAGKRKAQATLAEKGLSQAWEISEAYKKSDDRPMRPSDESLSSAEEDAFYRSVRKWDQDHRDDFKVNDIVNRLVKYGSISDKTFDFLRMLVDRIIKRPEILAQRAAEKVSAADCPEGRIEITGTVVSVKEQDGPVFGYYDSGVTYKIVVKAESGFAVWMTKPSGLPVECKGAKVVIKATTKRSDTDSKFGFGKRPTLVSFEAPVQAAEETKEEDLVAA